MLYLDASALVKRYVDEDGTSALIQAMEEDGQWIASRIGYVETARAIGLLGGDRVLERFRTEWASFNVIELSTSVAERAAELAITTKLRTLDAIHLAAALALPGRDMKFATWDARLHGAAKNHGLTLLPDSLAT